MNTAHIKDMRESDRFLNLIDFKWLMARVDWWFNLFRLQCDQACISASVCNALVGVTQSCYESTSVEMLDLQRSSDARSNVAMGLRIAMGAEEPPPVGCLTAPRRSVEEFH